MSNSNTSNLKVLVRASCGLGLALVFFALSGCSTTGGVPEPRFKPHRFPKGAYIEPVKRPFKKLGLVRSKVNFATLDPNHEEDRLCRNYYNKAVSELLKHAREKKADAVVDVRSVTFLEDGRREVYKTPQCSDDGEEGQILLQGIAVQWQDEGFEPIEESAASAAAPPAPRAETKASAPVPAPSARPTLQPGSVPAPDPFEPRVEPQAAAAAEAEPQPAEKSAVRESVPTAGVNESAPAIEPDSEQPVTVKMSDYQPGTPLEELPPTRVAPPAARAPVPVPAPAPVIRDSVRGAIAAPVRRATPAPVIEADPVDGIID